MLNIQTVIASNQIFPETKRWVDRVKSNGGGFQSNSVAIANSFIKILKTKSYYSKIVYLLPMLGTGVGAAITPLIDKNNYGMPTNISFVDADFTQKTGLQGNGSNKRLDMPFYPGNLGITKNAGLGVWALNVSLVAGTQYCMGCFGGSTTFGLRFGNTGGDINCQFYWGVAGFAGISEVRSNSHYYGNRSSSTSRIIYKNGVEAGSDTTTETAAGDLTTPISSYAVNTSASYLVYWGGSQGIQYYTDGTFTSDEALDFHNIIANYLMGPTGKI